MLTLLLFVSGLVALVVGAEVLIRGAGSIARAVGLSPLVVGLTVVAFGTSAPEATVSIGSALQGQPNLVMGNVVGSNTFNVLVILGLSAVIIPLSVHSQIIRQELPIMIGTAALAVLFAFDGEVSRVEGILLSVGLILYTSFLVIQARAAPASETEDLAPNEASEAANQPSLPKSLFLVALGLVGLVVGADWLVQACVDIAKALGMSDLVIGLTIMAAGTSLPELAASAAAALRGQRDIAVGNIIGSNIFNILGCLGLAAVVAPQGIAVDPSVLRFDLWVMVAAFVICVPTFLRGRDISRREGAVFLLAYCGYTSVLLMNA